MTHPQTYPFIAALLAAYKATGKSLGVDVHLRIANLVESLPETTDFANLKTLIAPIIVGSPQQQGDFYDTFDTIYKSFDFQKIESTPSVFSLKNWKEWLKWIVGLLILTAGVVWLVHELSKPKPQPIAPIIFRHIVDIDRDFAGKKEVIDSFLGLQPSEKSLTVKNFDIYELELKSNFKPDWRSVRNSEIVDHLERKLSKSPDYSKHNLILTSDSTKKMLFYKPLSIGEDTFNFRFCLSNDSCYEQLHVFSVQKIDRGSDSTGGGWGGRLVEKSREHLPNLSSLIIVPHTEYSLKNAYMSGRKWATLGLCALVIWLLGFSVQQLRKRKKRREQAEQDAANVARKPNVAPPFVHQIRIKDVGKTHFDAVFSKITQQLRRRSEGEQQIFDPKRTVKATILRGGLATFRYRQPTHADEYLFLIDIHDVNDHRAQVFDLLYKTLERSEVLIDRFFYDGDMRLCWNETYRNGIKINELAHRFGSSRLVIIGTSAALIDASTGAAVEWITIFYTWRQRALLTPRAPSEWKASARVLAAKFRLLPANLKGMAALAETLEAVDPPDFRRWRTVVDPNFEQIILPEKLSAAAIWSNLEAEFTTYKNGKTDDRLLQWLAACAVSPVLHWDATLFFGHLIDNLNPQFGTDTPLVNLDNLFKINRLSWFIDGKMPESGRRALLDFLEKTHPSVLSTVRTYWDAVLQENLVAAQKAAEESGAHFNASVAFDELRLQMIVNDLQRNEGTENDRKKHLNELRGLTRGGKKGDFLALEILQKETEKEGSLNRNNLDFLKKNLHRRLENGEIDAVIGELLALTKDNPPLQERLKSMKLALRK